MKKVFSLLLCVALLVTCFAVVAAADEEQTEDKAYTYEAVRRSDGTTQELTLPFQVEAPTGLGLARSAVDDYGCSYIRAAVTKSAAFSKLISEKEDYEAWCQWLSSYGFEDAWFETQLDWALDDPDDWHANEYFLTGGYDAENAPKLGDWAFYECSCGEKTLEVFWPFYDGFGNPDDPDSSRWNGWNGTTGWKDVLKEGQYEIVRGDDDTFVVINWGEHVLYMRARFLVTVRTPEADFSIASDWSDVATYGKGIEELPVLKEGDIAAPQVSDLQLEPERFNEIWPVYSFVLTVPEELQKQAMVVGAYEGALYAEAQMRLDGGEWTDIYIDRSLQGGRMTADTYTLADEKTGIPDGVPTELRVRYYCSQYDHQTGDWLGEFYSDWSNVLSFNMPEVVPVNGDANGDGFVNLKDVLQLRKYIAGIVKEIDENLADCDRDGNISMKDVLLLRKFIAGLADLPEIYKDIETDVSAV